jgi:hypothetical protein
MATQAYQEDLWRQKEGASEEAISTKLRRGLITMLIVLTTPPLIVIAVYLLDRLFPLP